MTNVSPILSVRISANERDLLDAAAALTRTSISDFVRRKALESAEIEILNNNVVMIPAADWEKFEAWARAPARRVPALEKLAATRPVWED